MSTDLQTELHEFYEFVGELLRVGSVMSPEEVLDAWRKDSPDDQRHVDNVKALKAAVRDMQNGDSGVPFEEFDRDFRQTHDMPLDE